MERRRDPDDSTAAPGDLELVRSFLSLHDHVGDDMASLPPSTRSLEEFLRERGLIGVDELATEEELEEGLRVHQALHRKVRGAAVPFGPSDQRVAEAAARAAGLELSFAPDETPHLMATARGVRGALGRILTLAFVAELDGSWDRLQECGAADCQSVFYDRSKNHSGKWCSMRTCGNRNKVRAWRARQQASGVQA
jgi:hypothetical protein